MFIKIFTILLITFTSLLTSFAYDGFKANKLLITKLSDVKDTVAKNDPTWAGISLRMADLLSEQSRLCISKKCSSSQILKFRNQAIKLYKSVLPRLHSSAQLAVYSQLAHLLQLSNKNTAAIGFYKKALTLPGSTKAILAIQMALAQVYFKLGSYKTAISYYNQVLKQPSFEKYNLAVQKKSWALFRLNKINQATSNLESLIAKSYKEKTSGLVKVNAYFYSELLNDLVLFYSYKSNAPIKKAKQLLVWTPKKEQVKFLMFYAKELERLGHLTASIKLWNFNLEYLNSPKDRISAYQHITQVYYKSFLFKQATASFSALTAECKKNFSECKDYEVSLKNLLIDWFSAKKRRDLLFKSCTLFANLFPNNGDILVLAAQIGVTQKKWNKALQFYKKIEMGLKEKTIVFKDKKLLKLSGEHFLWTQIEVAELSKNRNLLQQTYKYFIENSKDKNKVFKIQYQKFVSLYENKQRESVAKDFPLIITQYIKTKSFNSKKIYPVVAQAVNLVLQSLVKLKKDQAIEKWIEQYQAYPFSKSANWKAYKKQAVLNQTAQLSKQGSNELAYNKLLSLPFNSLNLKEKINYYYNQISLLGKMQKKEEEAVVIAKLLNLKKHLTPSKYNTLVLRQVWLAELKLDFNSAFKHLLKLVNKNTSANRYLRLILFAKLSKKPLAINHKYYKQFFKKEKSITKKQALAFDLIKESNFNLKIFNKYTKYLSKKQYQANSLKVLNQLSANLGKLDKKFLHKILSSKKYSKNAETMFVSRFAHLEKKYKPWLSRITKHKIKTISQYQISKGLKRRLYLLGKGERLLKLVIKENDSVLQMFYSKALILESLKLHDEILNFPLPKGLNKEETQLYSSAIAEKAAVYKTKQKYYNQYYTQFWKNSDLLSVLKKQSQLNLNNSFLLNLFVSELKLVAPEDILTNMVVLENTLKEKLNVRGISNVSKKPALAIADSELKQKVKQFPENIDYIKAFIKEMDQKGNYSMSAYLNSRLASLNNKVNKVKE
ncbi:MAG: tetratricopeptide repeat protein [Bdellovibrionaceae bacterium]|nr:tetratricopeptide repeat protein [Pseudobdellovibrionaceae bacterium]